MKDYKEIMLLMFIMFMIGVMYIAGYAGKTELVKELMAVFILLWCGTIITLILKSRI